MSSKYRRFAVILACAVLQSCATSTAPPPSPAFDGSMAHSNIIDLTHTLDENFPYIPVPGVTFGFALEPIATIEKMGVAANAWRIHEHIGTQIDAPNHFSAGGPSLEALQAQSLVVPVAVIDFRRQSALDRDAVIQPEDLLRWERDNGRIPQGAVVALSTGWDRKIGQPSFIGLDEHHVKHFPGLGPEAVRFLVRERDVWGVAVDTISFDVGIDGGYAAHRELLGAGKWALEAVKDLALLPPRGAMLFIGAPKVRGATGGPVRVLAFVPKVPAPMPALAGQWTSRGIETSAGSRTSHLARFFHFDGHRWSVEFTVFADADGKLPLLRGRNEGTYSLGRPLPLAAAVEADFGFERRTLTPLTEDVAATLTAARCGDAPWKPGQAQDVTRGGCAIFRVPSAGQCPREFDVLRIDDGQLRLGPRPPGGGDLCDPLRRPAYAEGAPLVRPDWSAMATSAR